MSPWTFTPFPPLPATLLPNIAFYNATSANQTYQITISHPFEWNPPSPPRNNRTALTLYVIDGNALGLTASEALKRRVPVDASTPDTVVVSIGYPLTDAVYDLAQRRVDFAPPEVPGGPESGADAFLEFIGGALRPWVRGTVFPGVQFTRDALYGHSFGGLFVAYALVKEAGLFDTFLAASPALDWNGGSLLEDVSRTFGTEQGAGEVVANRTGPAVFIGYGGLEQFPARRRTEAEAAFQARKSLYDSFKMPARSHELFHRLKWSGRMRDVVIKEYAGQDHSGVGASAITDGIDYFVDW
ncbi:Alpha/Beta hydrolase protein [Lasiosphaeria hispida]|uniref:Alpha/Beta hydrolase protein n=1 Tax=Lasiosphaeria hispida TaxID=260671 RepID=A0AAJ0HEI7_9PEZI|nr:Alpha/Beta hydrolase protein [Lasiosphaeria hispida]